MSGMTASEIRGFNYSGSWGTSGLDLWQHHDHGLMAVEVERGKRYFPDWNLARWWLSHEAFGRNPARFLANVEAGLETFARHGVQVMPVLFNRWRDPVCDFGGVPLDHIVPGFTYFCPPGSYSADAEQRRGMDPWAVDRVFGDYLEAVVGAHRADERIFAWDVCNEPLSGPWVADEESELRAAELHWLTWCCHVCRGAGAEQPLTIGNIPHRSAIEITEPLVDLISFHPYYIPRPLFDDPDLPIATKPAFEGFLDEMVALGERTGKPIVASETVWGADDDAERVAIIEYTLGQLAQRRIGFVAHALHHSLVADLHAAEYGPVGSPERLEFINADGSLRAGHEAFNAFPPA